MPDEGFRRNRVRMVSGAMAVLLLSACEAGARTQPVTEGVGPRPTTTDSPSAPSQSPGWVPPGDVLAPIRGSGTLDRYVSVPGPSDLFFACSPGEHATVFMLGAEQTCADHGALAGFFVSAPHYPVQLHVRVHGQHWAVSVSRTEIP